MASARSTSVSLALAGPFLVWALHFVLLYRFSALACARGFADEPMLGTTLIPAVGGIATLIAAVVSVSMMWRGRAAAGRNDNGAAFLGDCRLRATGLALLAIGWNALPLVLVIPCRGP